MLKEIQVLPLPLHRIVNRAELTGIVSKAGPRRKTYLDVQLSLTAFSYLKVDSLHLPRYLQP